MKFRYLIMFTALFIAINQPSISAESSINEISGFDEGVGPKDKFNSYPTENIKKDENVEKNGTKKIEESQKSKNVTDKDESQKLSKASKLPRASSNDHCIGLYGLLISFLGVFFLLRNKYLEKS